MKNQNKTLLQKAKEVQMINKKRSKITDEHIELALAWLSDDVTSAQICIALGYKNRNYNNAIYSMAMYIKEAYQTGKITVIKK